MLFTVVRYYHRKFNVTWDDDESRVSYNLDTFYVYDEEKSYGDPNDYNITTLNVPLLVSENVSVDQIAFLFMYNNLEQLNISIVTALENCVYANRPTMTGHIEFMAIMNSNLELVCVLN